MHRFFKKTNKAFTLVETLVAISIFTVSMLGLMAVLSQGISDTNYAKRKIIAEYLAQEGIEYVRNMRDTYVLYTIPGGWDAFKPKLSPCGSTSECGFDNTLLSPDVFVCATHDEQCKLYEDNGNYNTNSLGDDSGFVRTIHTDRISDDEIKVFSTVSWMQGSGERSVTFSENLFNWAE
ncbi:MAG: hypothetical protein UU10_C0015G0025 [Parcubacteria group bacterium GW2011_GWF1_40_6]|uniref:Type IV pilus modification protein PilV n=2 Tax=Candidatus Nomuraibacteriota TaxID=1752729 RepID=A0A0G0T9F3_9BACT|nr:MAG: hypothetical protein UT78_C0002G0035 [Candidatus Nomurabacteria bacterium GW2011_GWF2_40_12]KKR69195.1 MAG: hypothetical protein UU10_C0015G0025 [Parcubacteria group bacterium GW2011_GWF1_40_6]OGJ09362.1 MAG: hypothetical protein A2356_00725 [Candidatus Nomurabacteria bacterium RIFOXYB1_FULL_39_16]OGJ14530.1 MAG: hypothetical protein A2585_02835 [Candidatus Nomurabacteria bacterium RIFOXYD1_FULL_39_12]